MELNTALETAKAIHEAGMSVTAELVAELQSATPDEALVALEALVLEGRLYSAHVNTGGGDGNQDYAFVSYIPLVA
jgi:hypothetical protein